MKYKLLSVDLQNDFATEDGRNYKVRPAVKFVKETLIPFLKDRKIQVNEIVSDYRAPRPGDRGAACEPGTWGYESIMPQELVSSRWIKCMNSPIWVRKNIGDASKTPGVPYQDTAGFDRWILDNFGKPGGVTPILFGLTIDCCVLATLQEFSWRGYKPLVLYEGVDHYDGTESSKDAILKSPVPNWGDIITWSGLMELILLYTPSRQRGDSAKERFGKPLVSQHDPERSTSDTPPIRSGASEGRALPRGGSFKTIIGNASLDIMS
ncbi:MAG: hypothetical protein HY226_05210 [Candidatus Vogelbacteria bacterium]|nr:hypothetical protein [Candidatus Vogelbacteria bacterium]